MIHRECCIRRTAGFTLMELLVALMLLGLISAMALGGVRLGARTWETVAEKTGDDSHIQIVRAFLERELAQAVPAFAVGRSGESRLAYEGDRETLVFVAPVAPHFGLGGLQRLELALVDGGMGEGKQLILKRRLFQRDDGTNPPAGEAEEDETHLLLDGIAEAEFAFREGARDSPAFWSADWRDRDGLPAIVRLRVSFVDTRRPAWPDLLVAGRITTVPGCMPADTAAGCRRR